MTQFKTLRHALLTAAATLLPTLCAVASPLSYTLSFNSGAATASINLTVDSANRISAASGDGTYWYNSISGVSGSWTQDGKTLSIGPGCMGGSCTADIAGFPILKWVAPMCGVGFCRSDTLEFHFRFFTDLLIGGQSDGIKNGVEDEYQIDFSGFTVDRLVLTSASGSKSSLEFSIAGKDLGSFAPTPPTDPDTGTGGTSGGDNNVPEPGALSLAALGLIALGAMRRRPAR